MPRQGWSRSLGFVENEGEGNVNGEEGGEGSQKWCSFFGHSESKFDMQFYYLLTGLGLLMWLYVGLATFDVRFWDLESNPSTLCAMTTGGKTGQRLKIFKKGTCWTWFFPKAGQTKRKVTKDSKTREIEHLISQQAQMDICDPRMVLWRASFVSILKTMCRTAKKRAAEGKWYKRRSNWSWIWRPI